MARKPSYENLALGSESLAVPDAPAPVDSRQAPPTGRGRPPARGTIRDISAPFTLYLHPDGAKALKRYALEQNTKVHSLILEAVEDWFRRKGLREPIRVQTGTTRADKAD